MLSYTISFYVPYLGILSIFVKLQHFSRFHCCCIHISLDNSSFYLEATCCCFFAGWSFLKIFCVTAAGKLKLDHLLRFAIFQAGLRLIFSIDVVLNKFVIFQNSILKFFGSYPLPIQLITDLIEYIPCTHDLDNRVRQVY